MPKVPQNDVKIDVKYRSKSMEKNDSETCLENHEKSCVFEGLKHAKVP